MNKKALENKIEALEKQLEKLKKEVNSPGFEGIKKDEKYFFFNYSGFICEFVWTDNNPDSFHFNIGKCFKPELWYNFYVLNRPPAVRLHFHDLVSFLGAYSTAAGFFLKKDW